MILRKLLNLVLVSALIAGAVVGQQYLPSIGLRAGERPKLQAISVKAKDLQLVCPGAAFRSGGATGTKVGLFDRVGSTQTVYASSLPNGVTLKSYTLMGSQSNATALMNTADTPGRVAISSGADAFALTVLDPAGIASQGSSLVTAQSFQIVRSSAMNGALAANCQRPGSEQWLLGSNTSIGREALLILANPAATDATVDLQIFGQNGPIDGAGLTGISVSANRFTVLPLSSFASDQELLAVRVSSKGAAIAAWAQQRTVRGTLAAGADLISPSIPAGSNLVIPGLFKRGSKDASTLISGNPNYNDLSPSLAVFVPGGATATITAQVIGTDTKTFGTVVQQQISGGSAGSIPLNGLKDGNYAVFVNSDQPVLASVRLSRTNLTKTPNTDFAWLPAVSTASGIRMVTTPSSATTTVISKLSVANPNPRSARVTVSNLSAGTKSVFAIPRLSSSVVSVSPGSLISIESDYPVATTMISDFDWLLAVIGLVDYKNVGGSLSVLVR